MNKVSKGVNVHMKIDEHNFKVLETSQEVVEATKLTEKQANLLLTYKNPFIEFGISDTSVVDGAGDYIRVRGQDSLDGFVAEVYVSKDPVSDITFARSFSAIESIIRVLQKRHRVEADEIFRPKESQSDSK